MSPQIYDVAVVAAAAAAVVVVAAAAATSRVEAQIFVVGGQFRPFPLPSVKQRRPSEF